MKKSLGNETKLFSAAISLALVWPCCLALRSRSARVCVLCREREREKRRVGRVEKKRAAVRPRALSVSLYPVALEFAVSRTFVLSYAQFSPAHSVVQALTHTQHTLLILYIPRLVFYSERDRKKERASCKSLQLRDYPDFIFPA